MHEKNRISKLIDQCYCGLKLPYVSTTLGAVIVPSILMVATPTHAATPPQLTINLGTKDNPEIITQTEFKKNSATDGNASALKVAGHAKGENITFENNTGTLHGGAVHVENNASLTLVDSKFTNNVIDNPNNQSVVASSKSEIQNKPQGGAILNDGSLVIIDGEFSNNKAIGNFNYYQKIGKNTYQKQTNEGFGGAIDNRGTLTVTGTTEVTQNENGEFTGGVLFKNNHSYSAGAVNLYGGNASFTNVLFESNSSEGGGGGAVKINNSDSEFEFVGTVFKGNTTENNGGAISIEAAKSVLVKDSQFLDNVGNGAIFVGTNSTLNLEGTNIFSGNTSTGGIPLDIANGGTVNINDGKTTIGGSIGSYGKLNINKGILVLDADNEGQTVKISNVVKINDEGSLYVVGLGKIENTVTGNQGKITLADKTQLSIETHYNKLLQGSFTVTGENESSLTLKQTGQGYTALYGNDDSEINVGSFSIDSKGVGIYSVNGKQTITANSVDVVKSTFGIFVQPSSNNTSSSVSINGFENGLNVNSDSVAVVNQSEGGDSSVLIDGVGDVRLFAKTYQAVFVYGEKSNTTVQSTQDISISSESASSIGVEGGTLNIKGAQVNIGAESTSQTSIDISANGSLTLSATGEDGSINVQGDVVTSGDHKGKLTLAGGRLVIEGSVDGFKGIFEQTGGTVVLDDNTKVFGGDINVNGGMLQYGDINLSDAPKGNAVLAIGDQLILNDNQTITVGAAPMTRMVKLTQQLPSGSKLHLQPGALLIMDMDAKVTTGTFDADAGSQIHLVDARDGVDVLDANHDIVTDGVNVTAGHLLTASIDKDGVVSVMADPNSAFLLKAIPVNALTSLIEKGSQTDATDIGKQFLSRSTDGVKYALTESVAIATINEVSRVALTANVQNTALRIADLSTDSVFVHMSLNAEPSHSTGWDIWATPLYGNLYASDMVTGSSSVRSQFGGLSIGADFEATQWMNGKVRFGVGFNAGAGQSDIDDTMTRTENDYEFGGVNIYAGWSDGALNIVGSVGYAAADHEVEMGLPSALDIKAAKTDIDTTAVAAKVRAEYLIKTDTLNVLPHVGVQYTALKTDGHDLLVNGSVLNRVTSDTQHIWQFPVGVTVNKDFNVNGWNIKPTADVSVVLAAGDKDAHTHVQFNGINEWDDVDSRMMDTVNWTGSFGVQAAKDNYTIGVNYMAQASDHETNQSVQFKFGWKF